MPGHVVHTQGLNFNKPENGEKKKISFRSWIYSSFLSVWHRQVVELVKGLDGGERRGEEREEGPQGRVSVFI